MSSGTSNVNGHQLPMGDRSLNYSAINRDGINHNSGCVLKMSSAGRSGVHSNPQISSSRPLYSNGSSYCNNMNFTPNHRQSSGGISSAPFKSPITLCFDRMLGAGKILRNDIHFYDAENNSLLLR